MQSHRLENLGERLLRAGVAPRHVRRFLRELRDHHEDAVNEEQAKGASRAAAERAAWDRLGDEEHLARSVLARPELRSMAARFPGAVFGAGPVLLWIASIVLTMLALGLFFRTVHSEGGPVPAWVHDPAHAVCFFYARILPVALGAAMLIASARRRLDARWPVLGVVLMAAVCGTTGIDVTFAAAVGEKGALTISSSLVPFLMPFTDALGEMDIPALAEGLARAGIMLVLLLPPYLLGRRRRVATAA